MTYLFSLDTTLNTSHLSFCISVARLRQKLYEALDVCYKQRSTVQNGRRARNIQSMSVCCIENNPAVALIRGVGWCVGY